MTINRTYLIIGGILGFLGVAIGAFGAHSLKPYIAPEMLEIYKTGVMYQLIHVVIITALSLAGDMFRKSLFLFTVGIVLFSFSLYIYALTGIKTFALITPVGGLLFLAGWVFVVVSGLKK